MSGNGAEDALQLYAGSDFCLQPPGDTLPRPGIIDALSVGCVPVLFHPRQAELWPHHWRGAIPCYSTIPLYYPTITLSC